MPAKNKEEPLAIKVICKECNHTQVYRGQINCNRCKKPGSLQLILKKVA